jgi:adenine deaminase
VLLVVFSLLSAQAYAAPPNPIDDEVQAFQVLKEVALGRAPADVFIKVGKAFNTNTYTWQDNWGFAVKAGRIAWSGPSAEWKGQAANAVDATAYAAIPGMCNAHHHLESMHMDVIQAAKVLWPFGETCEFEASHELGNAFKPEKNVEYWLKGWDIGFRVYPLPPTAAPPSWAESTAAAPGTYDRKMLAKLFEDPRVVGSDELMDLPNLLDPKMPGYKDMWNNKVWSVLKAGRVVEGHIMSLTEWGGLSAVAPVLRSNHENQASGVYGSPLSAGEIAYRKLLLGIDLLIRGEEDAAAIFPFLVKQGLKDWTHISVVTDDRSVEKQLLIGGMNYNVRQAIASGVPVEEAIAMATINPARHFQKGNEVGCLNPGCYADMAMLSGDVTRFQVAETYVGGKLVAKDGKLVASLPAVDMSAYTANSINLGRKMTADDFAIYGPKDKATATAAVLAPFWFGKAMTATVQLVNRMVVLTHEQQQEYAVWSIVDRYHGAKGNPGGATNILYKGVGPLTPETSICMSEGHDSHNLQALSNSPVAAAACINEIAKIEGGYVLVSGGKVLAEVRLEVGGLMTTAEPAVAAAEFDQFWKMVDSLQWIGGEDGKKAMREMRFWMLTCDPWVDQAVAKTSYAPTGLIDVTTMQSLPIVY